MRKFMWVAGALLVAACLAAAGCGGGGGDPLVIGAVYNLTGDQSELDIPSADGARLAVDQANEAGGALGRQIELAVEDGATDPEAIAEKVVSLLDRHPTMPALLGLSDTDMALAAARPAADAGRLFLTSGATSPRLPDQVPEWLFLACFGDNVQAAAAAEWTHEVLRAKTAAVLYNTGSSYTMLLQGYFRARFEQLGGTIASSTPYAADSLSAAALRSVARADVVFLSAQPEDAVRAVGLLRAAGYAMPIVGGDGLDAEDLWQAHPDVSDVFFTTHAYLGEDNADPVVTVFREAFARAHPGIAPDAFTALGYDAARLLLDAVSRAGSDDPVAVREALAATHDFKGVTGLITFAGGSRIPSKSVTILEIRDGGRRFVTQRVPEVVPAP